MVDPVADIEGSVAAGTDASAPCSVCREPIKVGARKCVRCDSMLDWRRWLGISETTLALLVALVSVIGGTAPRIMELFTPKASALHLSIRQVYGQNLEVIAWNQGHMSSQFQSARISAKTLDGTQLGPVPLQILGGPTVLAEQQSLFGLQIAPALIPTFLGWAHPTIQSATLTIVVNEYNKQPEVRTLAVPIEYFHLFCRATEDSDRIARNGGQVVSVDIRLTSHCVT